MIKFNRISTLNESEKYVNEVLHGEKLSGDGKFTQLCNSWLEREFKSEKVMLTTSCTHSLEMAAILADIKPGDEVIAPSYTFVSTVNAFVLRGAKIVFVDIRPDTMNIDENLIESAITPKTKVILPVHYAGVACEMDIIMEIAKRNNLIVVEDAAQAVMSKYKEKYLGTIGDFGCYSFHDTKNYSMGEGGALLIKDSVRGQRAEIIREKGTNRSRFLRGQIDKYTWVDIGSSYLPSELNAAYLYGQLEEANTINNHRLDSWELYYQLLEPLSLKGFIALPFIPESCQHNAHMFYIKCLNLDERTKLIEFLKDKKISTAFHYIPLHSSEAGLKYGRFHGKDSYSTTESERLLRLPMYYGLKDNEIEYICNKIKEFYLG